jgi:hypothetical protein
MCFPEGDESNRDGDNTKEEDGDQAGRPEIEIVCYQFFWAPPPKDLQVDRHTRSVR